MKKVTNLIKSNTKIIAAFILGTAVSGGSVYAATILMNANQVGFDKTGTSLSSTDVQGALNELYTRSSTWMPPIQDMQNFDKSVLSTTGSTAVLKDSRDGNMYIVKKLADGNIWMTQNLRLINKTISSADSNLQSGLTWTIPSSDPSTFMRNLGAARAYYNDDIYGTYYNYYAATAGTGGTSLTSGNVPSDICPKNWRLPTDSEFSKLYNKYPSSALMQGEPGFVLSGQISYNVLSDTSSVKSQGTTGYYWASNVNGSEHAFGRSISSGGSYGMQTYRYEGNSVRCIAK
jgi:uncharacterized protein (TIGR02145 family)